MSPSLFFSNSFLNYFQLGARPLIPFPPLPEASARTWTPRVTELDTRQFDLFPERPVDGYFEHFHSTDTIRLNIGSMLCIFEPSLEEIIVTSIEYGKCKYSHMHEFLIVHYVDPRFDTLDRNFCVIERRTGIFLEDTSGLNPPSTSVRVDLRQPPRAFYKLCMPRERTRFYTGCDHIHFSSHGDMIGVEDLVGGKYDILHTTTILPTHTITITQLLALAKTISSVAPVPEVNVCFWYPGAILEVVKIMCRDGYRQSPLNPKFSEQYMTRSGIKRGAPELMDEDYSPQVLYQKFCERWEEWQAKYRSDRDAAVARVLREIQGETRQIEAETEASQEETRQIEAEAEAFRVETRQIEAKARQTEAKARQTEAKARQTEAKARQTEEEAEAFREKTRQIEAEAEAMEERCDRLQEELNRLYAQREGN